MLLRQQANRKLTATVPWQHPTDSEQRQEYLIAQDGKLAGVGAHSYSPGNATGGSDEAEKFKKGQ